MIIYKKTGNYLTYKETNGHGNEKTGVWLHAPAALKNKEESTAIDFSVLNQMVDSFLAQGFTYFDTAYMYHGGHSETAMREALVKRYPRDSFQLADKMPTMFLKQAEDHERIFNEQLERCGVSFLIITCCTI